jgi:GMP synthase (glutamine-hydrolysing)
MRIGILQAGHMAAELQPLHGDTDTLFMHLLAGHGFEFQAYDVEHMQFPESPEDCDGWLIPGSKHGAYEDHPFIKPLEDFIRDCVARDIPLVGVCFGHQIIAQALGGEVVKWPKGWALGKSEYETSDGTVSLNAWHQDQVTKLPEGAEVLGGNTYCANAFLSYGRHAFTIQPHPEFGDGIIRAMVESRKGTGTYPDALMDAALREARTCSGSDADRVATAIAHFFKERVAHVAL